MDADAVVHSLYERQDVQRAVAQALGLNLPLRREAVAQIVFTDAAALRRLEALIHPLVAQEMQGVRDAADPQAVTVLEYPLPVMPQPGDVVVCVEAPERLRIERLRGRGMSDADIHARMAAAPGPIAYRAHAQHVILNDDDMASLATQVHAFWEEVCRGTRSI